MPTKKSKASGFEILALPTGQVRVRSAQPAFGVISGNNKLRNSMHSKVSASANGYLCAIERNQNGKYNVRVRAVFAPGAKDPGNGRESNGHRSWMLPVYFLASSFNGAMKKLEESLQLLQKNEAKLRFWGVERTDDPNLAGDLLKELASGSTGAATSRAKWRNSTCPASARSLRRCWPRFAASWPTRWPRNARSTAPRPPQSPATSVIERRSMRRFWCSSPPQQFERVIDPLLLIHGQIDPQQRQRLEQPRIPQRSHIHGLEPRVHH